MASGDLDWYQHMGRSDGTVNWSNGGTANQYHLKATRSDGWYLIIQALIAVGRRWHNGCLICECAKPMQP